MASERFTNIAVSPPIEQPQPWTGWLTTAFARQAIRNVFALLFVALLFIIVEYKLVLLTDRAEYWTEWIWKGYSLLAGLFLLSRFIIVGFYRDAHAVRYHPRAYPSVSVVIAGKNEEAGIFRTIEACMRSSYPGPLECIAVNDGSTDRTGEEMERAARAFKRTKSGVHIIHFAKNRGKREGMAEGVLASSGSIIVFVDSDSFVEPDAIRIIVEHFMGKRRIGAVAGNTGVENVGTNTLTKMQSARYGVSYDIFKVAESVFGAVSCCSGCFSAYRRSAVLPVLERWRNQTFLGSPSTFGDDRSLTNFVLRTWDIIYCRAAKATTIVPDTWRVLWRQQFRWKKSWIREGTVAVKYIWRKHPIAALSLCTNVILPVLGPVVAFYNLIYAPLVHGQLPLVFLTGIISMGLLFGMFYYMQSFNGHWWYVTYFSVLYVCVLVWQMPWAVVRLKDTQWGTR